MSWLLTGVVKINGEGRYIPYECPVCGNEGIYKTSTGFGHCPTCDLELRLISGYGEDFEFNDYCPLWDEFHIDFDKYEDDPQTEYLYCTGLQERLDEQRVAVLRAHNVMLEGGSA